MTTISMLELRFGYFPQRFKWGESVYHVHAMSRVWTTMGKSSEKDHFRVRCKRESGDGPKRAILDLSLVAGDKWAIENVISKED